MQINKKIKKNYNQLITATSFSCKIKLKFYSRGGEN